MEKKLSDHCMKVVIANQGYMISEHYFAVLP